MESTSSVLATLSSVAIPLTQLPELWGNTLRQSTQLSIRVASVEQPARGQGTLTVPYSITLANISPCNFTTAIVRLIAMHGLFTRSTPMENSAISRMPTAEASVMPVL